MEKVLRLASRHELILGLRVLAVDCLATGIVTAATDTLFGSWVPLYWFLLAFAGFLGVICAQLLRVMLLIEAKQGS